MAKGQSKAKPWDLAVALGAHPNAAVERFAIYLPDRDKDNNPVQDIEDWIGAAMTVLTGVNGGATRMAPSQGMWKSPSEVIYENTTLVYSYLMNPGNFVENFAVIRELVHGFGRETKQGEVMVEYSGASSQGFYSRSYSVTKYD